MAGGFPIAWDVCNCNDYGTVFNGNGGRTVTAAGSANVKGSFSQLIAVTAADISMLGVTITGATTGVAGAESASVDIAIGAAGSEIIVIPDIVVSSANTVVGQFASHILVPLQIPAGTR